MKVYTGSTWKVTGLNPDSPVFVNTVIAPDFNLDAIAETKAVTAADVFVYDTSKDSDGGAWRKRTQHTSWYNETLNTATRGSRKEFPAVAVIVAESNQVTIYDGDDPSLPMWMVFNNSSGNMAGGSSSNNSVVMLNGDLVLGATGYAMQISFVKDSSINWYVGQLYEYKGNISERNVAKGFNLIKSYGLINSTANDVAMTVRPNAPIDAATGLPVPTIAVATDGGVSVIKDDGTVVDILTDGQNGNKVFKVAITDNKYIDQLYGYSNSSPYVVFRSEIPSADTSLPVANRLISSSGIPAVLADNNNSEKLSTFVNANYMGGALGLTYLTPNLTDRTAQMVTYTTSTYNTGWMNGDIKLATLSDTDDTDVTGSELVTNGTFDTDLSDWTVTGGSVQNAGAVDLTTTGAAQAAIKQAITTVAGQSYILSFDKTSEPNINADLYIYVGTTSGGSQLLYAPAKGLLAVGTYEYTFKATTDTAHLYFFNNVTSSVTTSSLDNISVRLAEADRSVNNNGLIVNGTITKTPVATGADLVGYSGFSTSNYLQQPYNSDLDFGTGDFCVMGWVKTATALAGGIASTQDDNLVDVGFAVLLSSATHGIVLISSNGGARSITTGPTAVNDGSWHHFVASRTNSGATHSIYIDGSLDLSETVTARDITATSKPLTVGQWFPNSGTKYHFHAGSIALLRISATAPTAEQIAKIYEDEKFLFQENSQATLYGSSDAVTALAYDDDTELLHAGTSAGRSVFQGLRRVDNTTDAVGAAISASNGLVAED